MRCTRFENVPETGDTMLDSKDLLVVWAPELVFLLSIDDSFDDFINHAPFASR